MGPVKPRNVLLARRPGRLRWPSSRSSVRRSVKRCPKRLRSNSVVKRRPSLVARRRRSVVQLCPSVALLRPLKAVALLYLVLANGASVKPLVPPMAISHHLLVRLLSSAATPTIVLLVLLVSLWLAPSRAGVSVRLPRLPRLAAL